MDYVFNRRHSSPWSDSLWSLQHMHVVCVSQLTSLLEEMIETIFLGSWIWIAKHRPILRLPYDKKTLAQFEAWCPSWTPGMFAWVVTPDPPRPFPGSKVFLYRRDIDTCKVTVSLDLVIRNELRVRWQNETLGSIASYSDWGVSGFVVELKSLKSFKNICRRNTTKWTVLTQCAPGWPTANVRKRKSNKAKFTWVYGLTTSICAIKWFTLIQWFTLKLCISEWSFVF